MQGGSSLILCVTRLGKSRKGAEIDRAVDDVASRRESVSQNVGSAAVAVNISAVGFRDTRGRRATLGDDLAEYGAHTRDSAG